MRSVTKYYAFDGTEFDTAEECLAYEAELHHRLNEVVIFFDSNRNILVDPTPDIVNDKAYYMYILNKAGCEDLFNWLIREVGFVEPTCRFLQNEVLCWDNDKETWKNMTVEYKVLKIQHDSIVSKATLRGDGA